MESFIDPIFGHFSRIEKRFCSSNDQVRLIEHQETIHVVSHLLQRFINHLVILWFRWRKNLLKKRSKTHKGNETYYSHMFALSDTREYSFTQVPYLDIEEKDNWPKELRYNVIVNFSPRNRIHSKNRQLKQKRRRRLQKRHFKVNSRCFKFVARIPPRSDRQMLANVWGVKN